MKYVSLFAGIGGFDLALNRLGHECVYVNEWDKYAAEIYEKNFKYKPDTRDIKTVGVSEVPDHDLLVGGFPCQSFSVAGKRGGFQDTRGNLFFDIARIAKAKRPSYLLLENVKGLLSHDEGNTFATIISVLDELGYDLQWQVCNSRYFTGQNRERIYIFASLRGQSRQSVFPLTFPTERNLTKSKTSPKNFMACLTTRSARSRLAADMGYVYTENGIRDLTSIERERLQGFPDNWTEGLSETQRAKVTGNAATVNVVEAIMRKFYSKYTDH
jgi:DNA (cytosine-5)-methyltransferase 1